jgi:hypothetical protein
MASLEALGIQDADLIVDLHPGQLDAFAQAFASDFYVDRGLIQQALKRGTSFNIIHFESSFKVDFFVVSGRNFNREEFSRRLLCQVDPRSEFEAYVQTPEDAVLSKLDWYRMGGGVSDTQWRDVIGILRIQSGQGWTSITCASGRATWVWVICWSGRAEKPALNAE